MADILTIDALVERIRDWLTVRRGRRTALARALDWHPTRISEIASPGWNPTLARLRAIEAGMEQVEAGEAKEQRQG